MTAEKAVPMRLGYGESGSSEKVLEFLEALKPKPKRKAKK